MAELSELDETARQMSEHAVWKESTNLYGITLLNSTRPSEELESVLGDSGDMPAFDAGGLAAGATQPPKPSQLMMMPRRTDSTSTADEAQTNKLFWLIGADHPATAGFKEGRRGPAMDRAVDVQMCGGSCSSASKLVHFRAPPPEITDADLSTVQFSTRQQRLDWRDFLCEIVATSQVSSLFTLFDVEAEPPKYARPPPSAAFNRAGFSCEEGALDPASKGGFDSDTMSVGTVAQEADALSEDAQQGDVSHMGSPLAKLGEAM
mmetsp:Transcript_9274/g.16715  ORF Transcript_9274/g.16715 Transcript_9274/m.16715 type:complete len:263 (-) Transcript_9274:104-892(-)